MGSEMCIRDSRVGDQQIIQGGKSLPLPPSLIYELSSDGFGTDIAIGAYPTDLDSDGNNDLGFNLEIAVALAEFGITPGQPFGINVHYNDDDNGDDRDGKFTWTGRFGLDIDYLEPSALATAVIGN